MCTLYETVALMIRHSNTCTGNCLKQFVQQTFAGSWGARIFNDGFGLSPSSTWTYDLCQNSTYSICCGFVVQQVVQQIYNKSNKWSLGISSISCASYVSRATVQPQSRCTVRCKRCEPNRIEFETKNMRTET